MLTFPPYHWLIEMKKLHLIVFAAFAFLATGIAFACDYPLESPTLPDGSTASKEEMVAAQKEVSGYVEKLKAYQQCIEEEEAEARAQLEDPDPEVLKRRTELLDEKWSAAQAEQHKAADAFNAELHEFQAREEE